MTNDLDRALGIDQPAEGEQERQQDRLEGMRLCLYESDDLDRIPEPVPLVEGWLELDSLAWLFGERGHRKSFSALDLAGCVGGGIDWHGYATKQATVLYVICEGVSGLRARVRAWEDYHARKHEAVFLAPRPRLRITRDAPSLGTLAAEMDAGLVIIDTQNRAAYGLDENSNTDMGHLIDSLDDIREQSRACILTVHHSAVGSRRPRGHGSIDGAAAAMIRVASDGQMVKIENSKQREEERSAALVLTAKRHGGSLVLASSADGSFPATDSETAIIRALRDLVATKENVTHSDLKQACVKDGGMGDGTFNWALRRLIERGAVVRKARSYYPGQGHVQGQLAAVPDLVEEDPPGDE